MFMFRGRRLPEDRNTMSVKKYLNLVAFPHTVFALPFALMSLIVASGGMPSLRVLALVFVCMVGARNSAMAFNRLLDKRLDAANPRTQNRPLPSGEMTVRAVAVFTAVNALVFLAACYALNPLAFLLSPLALALIFFYSYTKRFTWLSHIVLGLCLAIAPVGAWVAATGSIGVPSLLLAGAVCFWVAGFDILYSLQDMDFDRAHGLFSIPARWGLESSLWIARALHLGCVCLMILFGISASLSALYFLGLAAVALLLSRQHLLVRKGDLSRIGQAFFTVNGWVSICLFLLVLWDIVRLP